MRFFNFDLNEARFEAFVDEIWFFVLFSLIWPLGCLSGPNLELLELSLFNLGSLDFLMTPPPNH